MHVLLGQKALMLALQINAPLDRVFELFLRVLQNFDGLRVVHAHKIAVNHGLQLGNHPLFDAFVEKLHVVGALGKHRLEDKFQQGLGQRRVIGQVGKGDFGLDHPEFSEMAAGIGVLSPERWAEGVNPGQRHAIGLHVQLTRHRQEGFAAKKVFGKIDLAAFSARQIGQVQRRNSKQLAGAFGV